MLAAKKLSIVLSGVLGGPWVVEVWTEASKSLRMDESKAVIQRSLSFKDDLSRILGLPYGERLGGKYDQKRT